MRCFIIVSIDCPITQLFKTSQKKRFDETQSRSWERPSPRASLAARNISFNDAEGKMRAGSIGGVAVTE